MQAPKSPEESKRLEVLSGYDILDTAPDAAFDRVTRLTQAAIRTPIAMISLIDEHRQWVKSSLGISIREIPRETSICAHVIGGNEPLIIRDVREDGRFQANPLVEGDPNIRFYAGVPLTASGGLKLGALSVADTEPRTLTEREIVHLQDLARLTIDLMEFRKAALSDSLTGLCTRRAFLAEAARQVSAAKRNGRPLACVIFDIDHFKLINDNYGIASGDLVLQAVADVCRRALRKIDVASHVGGEEFGLLLPETSTEGALRAAERVREAIAGTTVGYGGHRIQFSVSLGLSLLGADEDNASGLIKRAEQALVEAKQTGRNRTAVLAPIGEQPEAPQRARIAVRR
jgi:diguanylate cyclase (GGDEF)-like protein